MMRNILGQWSLIILFVSLTFTPEALSDTSSGWRAFSLGTQEGISNDVFALERLEFIRPVDVMARIKVKNIGKEEASFALSLAFFDSDKNLLTAGIFAPPTFSDPKTRSIPPWNFLAAARSSPALNTIK